MIEIINDLYFFIVGAFTGWFLRDLFFQLKAIRYSKEKISELEKYTDKVIKILKEKYNDKVKNNE